MAPRAHLRDNGPPLPLDSPSGGVSRYSDILSTQKDALKRIR